ncbi:preprotein translocase subunit SecG [Brevundimonas balnearis]|uniref:Protein-export membrane protein SecG n=1 Tax=Brevundimonas balnearis TaxID=1572858 RepID=A0ABV6QZ83_9CAUL
MLQTILLVVMILISLAMTGVILLQRSEGGALGMGGGPSGFMTARGAGNLLTQVTWILGALFFVCAIALTIVGNLERRSGSIIDADAVGAIALDAPSAEAPAAAAPQPDAPAAGQAAPSLDDLEASLPAASVAPAPAAQPAPAE